MLRHIFSLRAHQAASNIRKIEEDFLYRFARNMHEYRHHLKEQQAATDPVNIELSGMQVFFWLHNMRRAVESFEVFRYEMATAEDKHYRRYFDQGKSQLDKIDAAYKALGETDRKDMVKVMEAFAPLCPHVNTIAAKIRSRSIKINCG